ncbi:MAG: hypothetical protein Q9180_002207, partial [Flavoplaca navasiana]
HSRIMTLQSDLTIDASKFRPEAASNQIQKFNEYLMDTMKTAPKLFEVALPFCPKECLSLTRYSRSAPAHTEKCKQKVKEPSHLPQSLNEGKPSRSLREKMGGISLVGS